MKTRFKNELQQKRIKEISSSRCDLESTDNDLTKRFKINFSYFDNNQSAGYDFGDLTKEKLVNLFTKLKEHGKKSLNDLKTLPIGSGKRRRNVLEIYPSFPPKQKTSYKEPQFVPYQAMWGRIRLDYTGRLIGFVIPPEFHGKVNPSTNEYFDNNTFYVVFLDMDHKFWSS